MFSIYDAGRGKSPGLKGSTLFVVHDFGIHETVIVLGAVLRRGLLLLSTLLPQDAIDRNVFRPTPGDFRKQHGLEGKKVLLGVASVWDERKGLKDFVALSELLDESYRIVLIGLKDKQIEALPERILGLPRTNSLKELVQAYSEADLFLNPSAEETFGMTTLEALCCGTKAVVYRDTACEEIVEQFGGIAVDAGARNLHDAVIQLTKEEGK